MQYDLVLELQHNKASFSSGSCNTSKKTVIVDVESWESVVLTITGSAISGTMRGWHELRGLNTGLTVGCA